MAATPARAHALPRAVPLHILAIWLLLCALGHAASSSLATPPPAHGGWDASATSLNHVAPRNVLAGGEPVLSHMTAVRDDERCHVIYLEWPPTDEPIVGYNVTVTSAVSEVSDITLPSKTSWETASALCSRVYTAVVCVRGGACVSAQVPAAGSGGPVKELRATSSAPGELEIVWEPPADALFGVAKYEVQWRRPAQPEFSSATVPSTTRTFALNNLLVSDYELRVRSCNSLMTLCGVWATTWVHRYDLRGVHVSFYNATHWTTDGPNALPVGSAWWATPSFSYDMGAAVFPGLTHDYVVQSLFHIVAPTTGVYALSASGSGEWWVKDVVYSDASKEVLHSDAADCCTRKVMLTAGRPHPFSVTYKSDPAAASTFTLEWALEEDRDSTISAATRSALAPLATTPHFFRGAACSVAVGEESAFTNVNSFPLAGFTSSPAWSAMVWARSLGGRGALWSSSEGLLISFEGLNQIKIATPSTFFYLQGTTTLPLTNRWVHIAVVVSDDGRISAYLDGAVVHSQLHTSQSVLTSTSRHVFGSMYVGAPPYFDTQPGGMDYGEALLGPARLYTADVTSDEIRNAMRGHVSEQYADDMVLDLDFAHAFINSAGGTPSMTVPDSSQHGNHFSVRSLTEPSSVYASLRCEVPRPYPLSNYVPIAASPLDYGPALWLTPRDAANVLTTNVLTPIDRLFASTWSSLSGVINGGLDSQSNPVAYFEGKGRPSFVTSGLTTLFAEDQTGLSVFVVANIVNNLQNVVLFSHDAGSLGDGNGFTLGVYGGKLTLHTGQVTASKVPIDGVQAFNETVSTGYHVYSAVFGPSRDSYVSLMVDGRPLAVKVFGQGMWSPLPAENAAHPGGTVGSVYVGSAAGEFGHNHLRGALTDVLVFGRELPRGVERRVHVYLHAMTVPNVAHTYCPIVGGAHLHYSFHESSWEGARAHPSFGPSNNHGAPALYYFHDSAEPMWFTPGAGTSYTPWQGALPRSGRMLGNGFGSSFGPISKSLIGVGVSNLVVLMQQAASINAIREEMGTSGGFSIVANIYSQNPSTNQDLMLFQMESATGTDECPMSHGITMTWNADAVAVHGDVCAANSVDVTPGAESPHMNVAFVADGTTFHYYADGQSITSLITSALDISALAEASYISLLRLMGGFPDVPVGVLSLTVYARALSAGEVSDLHHGYHTHFHRFDKCGRCGAQANHNATTCCPNDCSGHGQCFLDTCQCEYGWGGAQCADCAPGFFGPHCTELCPGAPYAICSGHGVCDSGVVGSGLCSCDPAYYGELCDKECTGGTTHPCSLAGACDDGRLGTGTCSCYPGFEGSNCEHCAAGYYGGACTPCPGLLSDLATPCSGHGRCFDGKSGVGACVCDPGFAHLNCSFECPGGAATPCHNHGTCAQGAQSTGECFCDSGWAVPDCGDCLPGQYGEDCLSECDPCMNGECNDGTAGDGTCICQGGWFGQICNFQCPGGFASPCSGHGVCDDDSSGTGECACDPEWGGNAVCSACTPGRYGGGCSNECPACQHGGACNDGLSGDGTCTCPDGYWGDVCQHACPGGVTQPCFGNGACDDGSSGTGACICEAGYDVAVNCFDCTDDKFGAGCAQDCPLCSNGVCGSGINGTGACDCVSGFYGALCQNECPGGASNACFGHGSCSDGVNGTGLCTCDAGFDVAFNCSDCLDGHYSATCEQVCPTCANGVCDDGIGGDGSCTCASGYWSPLCDQLCPNGAVTPCHGHGVCFDGSSGNGTCACDAGFDTASGCALCVEGVYGTLCDAQCPQCDMGTCDDGLTGSGECVCESGVFGTLCQQECPSGKTTPCSGHGTCDDGRNGAGTCSCSLGFTAADCSECTAGRYTAACNQLCPDCHDGTCNDGVSGDGTCSCDPYYWGTLCDGECAGGAATPCSNRGNCSHGVSGDGSCTCEAKWQGAADCSECTTNLWGPSCEHSCPICQNGGSCDDGVAGTGQCVCVDGTYGTLCQHICPAGMGAAQCSGHGVCDDGVAGSGICTCDSGYAGVNCSIECPGGASNQCSGQGVCTEGHLGNGTCTCDTYHFGLDCASTCPGGVVAPCTNRGTCAWGSTATGACTCTAGYVGSACETCNVGGGRFGASCNECPGGVLTPCLERGVCDDGVSGGGQCACGLGFAGTQCESCTTSLTQWCVGERLNGTTYEFTMNGVALPELTLLTTVTYHFIMDDVTQSPFVLTTSANGGSSTLYTAGVRGQPAQSPNAVVFTPTTNAPDTLYYGSTGDTLGGIIRIQDYTTCSSSDTHFCVTVVPKTSAHPHYGVGSALGFAINGKEGVEVRLTAGVTYAFEMVLTEPDHPFYITTDPTGGDDGASIFTAGVTGQPATYIHTVHFTPDENTPVLYYQSTTEDNMGGAIVTEVECAARCFASDNDPHGRALDLLLHLSFEQNTVHDQWIADSAVQPAFNFTFEPTVPFFVGGRVGRGLTLNGNNEYAELEPVGLPADAIAEWTIAVWINTAQAEEAGMFTVLDVRNGAKARVQLTLQYSKSDPAYTLRHALWSGGSLVFQYQVPVSVVPGTWHLLVMQKSHSSKHVWFDGVKLNNVFSANTGSTAVDAFFSPSMEFRIGRTVDDKWPFMGVVDEVSFWSRSLSDSELSSLFSSPAALSTCGEPCISFGAGECNWPADASDTMMDAQLAYYAMDTSKGSTLVDTSPSHARGGLSSDGARLDDGLVYGGLTLASSPTTLAWLAPIQGGVGDFTLSVWVRFAADHTMSTLTTVASMNGAADRITIGFAGTATNHEVVIGGVLNRWSINGVPDPTDGEWHHHVLIRTGTSVAMYYDGTLVPPDSILPAAATAFVDESFILGSYVSATHNFVGDVDEIGFWARAMDASDLYSRGVAGQYAARCDFSTPQAFDVDTALSLKTALVSWWTMDEQSGTSISDVAEYEPRPATAVGATVTASGASGRARHFDGVDDRATTQGLALDVEDFAVSVWAKVDAGSAATTPLVMLQASSALLAARNCATFTMQIVDPGSGFRLQHSVDVSCDAADSVEYDVPIAVARGSWVHYALVRNGTQLHAYVDGVAQAQVFSSSKTSLPSGPLQLLYAGLTMGMSANTTNHWYGDLDEVGVWARALSAAEVAELYNGGSTNRMSAVCGNGVREVDEECDAGEENSDLVPDACRTDCTEAACGDGIVDDDEECDNGAALNSDSTPDACRADCTLPRCGDGVVDYGEDCDDGNTDAKDGCNPTCLVRAGGLTVDNTCVLTATNALRCWGRGSFGMLGKGDTKTFNVGDDELPAASANVAIGGTPVQLCAGKEHGCVLLQDGEVRCWGVNDRGQLGRGSTTAVGNYDTPASIDAVAVFSSSESAAGHKVSAVECGVQHTCVLTNKGAVKCWGNNNWGQCGVDPNTSGATSLSDQSTEPVSGLVLMGENMFGERVIDVAAGNTHTCALTVTGRVVCWGDNRQGQLGHGATHLDNRVYGTRIPLFQVELLTAAKVAANVRIVDLQSTGAHTCAIDTARDVYCWGSNTDKQLGYGDIGSATVGGAGAPTPLSAGVLDFGGATMRTLHTGVAHTCAVTTADTVKCWGEGSHGVLGYGGTIDVVVTPAAVADVSVGDDVRHLFTYERHTCAILTTGDIKCWGQNDYGQLGYGMSEDIGVQLSLVPSDVGVVADQAASSVVSLAGTPSSATMVMGAGRSLVVDVPAGVVPGTPSETYLLFTHLLVTDGERALVQGMPSIGSPLSPPDDLSPWTRTVFVSAYSRGFLAANFSQLVNATFHFAAADDVLYEVPTLNLYRYDAAWIAANISCAQTVVNATGLSAETQLCAPSQTAMFGAGAPLPVLSAVDPLYGLDDGDTEVLVTGTGLLETTVIQVRVGANTVPGAYDAAKGGVVFTTPANEGNAGQVVSVDLALNGVEYTTSGLTFTYYPEPQLSSVDVTSGPSTGGTALRITATNLIDTGVVRCKFVHESTGSELVRTATVDGSQVVCSTTAFTDTGAYSLQVSLNAQQYGDSQLTFLVYAPVNVKEATPKLLFIDHEESTLVLTPQTGYAFVDTESAQVTYTNGVESDVTKACTFVSSQKLQCGVPTWPTVSVVDVHVSMNGQQLESSNAQVSFYNSTFTSFVATAGPKEGGTDVTMHGEGFPADYSDVVLRFTDSVRSGDAEGTYTSSSELSAQSVDWSSFPVSFPYFVNIQVSFNGGLTFTDAPGLFTYYIQPRITSVTPASGQRSGGTTVLIAGDNIIDTKLAQCRFGSTAVAATFNSDGSGLTCTSPSAAAPGSVGVEVSLNKQDFTSDAKTFLFYNAPSVTALVPPHGPSQGGVPVTVVGTNFVDTGELAVKFGSVLVTPTYMNSTHMAVVSPYYGTAALVDVEVSLNSQQYTDDDTAFQYFSVFGIFPQVGSIIGGTTITVLAAGLVDTDAAFKCRVGTQEVAATYVSGSRAICVVPATATDGAAPVEMSLDGTHFSSSDVDFQYHPEIVISSFAPQYSPSVGDADVVITGTGFGQHSDSLTCRFALSAVAATYNAGTGNLECTTPPGAGDVPLEVSFNGIDYTSQNLLMGYYGATIVKPVSGDTLGGLTITVTGQGFKDVGAALKCRIGGVVSSGTFISSTTVTCVTPALGLGDVDVGVSMDGVDYSTIANAFTYHVPIVVATLTPNFGPDVGGTNVIVTAGGLADHGEALLCRFGSTPVPATLVGLDLLCKSPPGSGVVAVEVSTNQVQFSATGIEFTYFSVSALTPTNGKVVGGMTVTIHGSHLRDTGGDMKCRFDNLLTRSATFVSSTQITCVTPAYFAQVDAIPVEVSLNKSPQWLSGDAVRFFFHEEIRVTALQPYYGKSTGGTTVTVVGTHFGDFDSQVTCRIGSVTSPGVYAPAQGGVLCVTPPGTGEHEVEVSFNGEDFSDQKLKFNFYEVNAVVPRSGDTVGGMVATVTGSGFLISNTTARVSVAGQLISPSTISATKITFVTPSTSPGAYQVGVTLDAVETAVKPDVVLALHDVVQVSTVVPAVSATSGGGIVTLTGTNFGDYGEGAFCFFGSTRINGEYKSDTKAVECVVPPGGGSLAVEVSFNGLDVSSQKRAIQYFDLNGILPQNGNTEGGLDVTVRGLGFLDSGLGIFARFGTTVSPPCSLKSPSLILCRTPEYVAISRTEVAVALSLDGGVSFVSSDVTFLYHPKPVVESAMPLFGPSGGGTFVTVSGQHFDDYREPIFCRFGSSNVGATLRADKTLVCKSPVGFGTSDVQVTFNERDYSDVNSAVRFTYYALSAVFPLSGNNIGGLELTVSGSGFVDNGAAMKCLFDGTYTHTNGSTAAVHVRTAATWVSAVQIRCLAPSVPQVSGALDMSLSLDDGGNVARNDDVELLVHPVPVVGVPSPPFGPSAGGTVVRVSGEHFGNYLHSVQCRFGSLIVAGSYNASTAMVMCTAPPGSGTVDMQVSFNTVEYSASSVPFTYFSLESIEPKSGSTEGGLILLVTGQGFLDTGTIVCRFGDVATTPGIYVSPTSLHCVTPHLAEAATLAVAISLDGGDYAESDSGDFIFHAPIVVESVTPTSGPNQGGSLITLRGSSFDDYGETIMCVFGSTQMPAVYDADLDEVRCTSPPGGGEVVVGVTFNGRDVVEADALFAYYQINSIVPVSGEVLGGLPVTLSGFGFSRTELMFCKFGDAEVPGRFVSRTLVVCETPSTLDPGTVFVEVKFTEDGYTTNQQEFMLYTQPSLADLLPRNTVVQGGVALTLFGSNFVDTQTIKVKISRGADIVFGATYVSDTELHAVTPFVVGTGAYSLSVALNGINFAGELALHYFDIKSTVPASSLDTDGADVLVSVDGSYSPEQLDNVRFYFGNTEVSARFDPLTNKFNLTAPLANTALTRDATPPAYAITTDAHGITRAVMAYPALGRHVVDWSRDAVQDEHADTNVVDIYMSVGGDELVLVGQFEFYSDPSVLASEPDGTIADTVLTITGDDFVDTGEIMAALTVLGVTNIVPVTFVDSSTLTVVVPEFPSSGELEIRVAMNGQQYSEEVLRNDFVTGINTVILSITPASGTMRGGTEVTVAGVFPMLVGNVDGLVYASLGGELVTCTGFSSTLMTCVTPPLELDANGYVSFEITSTPVVEGQLESLIFTASGQEFFYYEHPLATHIVPTIGPTAGGADVTVHGGPFNVDGPGRWQCIFVDASDVLLGHGLVTHVDNNEIHCLSIALAPSLVGMYVMYNGQDRYPNPRFGYEFEACPPGYATDDFREPCKACPMGWHNPIRGGKCELCDDVSYTSEEGMPTCSPCPANTHSLRGAISIDQCLCDEGSFRVPGGSLDCLLCPRNALCHGEGALPVAREGAWASEDSPYLFLPCVLPLSCPGGEPGFCANGYVGRLCSECIPGYYKAGERCEPCPADSWIRIVAFVVVLLAFVPLFIQFGVAFRQYMPALAIGINFWQIVALLSKLKLEWPDQLRATFQWFSVFNFNIEFLSTECSMGIGYIGQWTLTMSLPWMFMCTFVLLYKRAIRKDNANNHARSAEIRNREKVLTEEGEERARPEHQTKLFNSFVNGYMLLMTIGYIFLTSKAVEIFDCSLQDDGKWTLDSDPSLLCFDEWWWIAFPFASVFVVVYGVGIPLVLGRILYNNSDVLDQTKTVERFGFLISHFHPDFFYWELMIMSRELVFDMSKIFFTSYPLLGTGMAAIALFSALLMHVRFQPYKSPRHNRLEAMLLTAGCFVLISGTMFYSERFPPGAERFVTWLIVIILILASSAVFFTIGIELITVRRWHQLERSVKGKELKDQYGHLLSSRSIPLCVRWLAQANDAQRVQFHSLLTKLNAFVIKHHRYRLRKPLPSVVFAELSSFGEDILEETALVYVYKWMRTVAREVDIYNYVEVVGSLSSMGAHEQRSSDNFFNRMVRHFVVKHRVQDDGESAVEKAEWLTTRLFDGTGLQKMPKWQFLSEWLLFVFRNHKGEYRNMTRLLMHYLAQKDYDKVFSEQVVGVATQTGGYRKLREPVPNAQGEMRAVNEFGVLAPPERRAQRWDQRALDVMHQRREEEEAPQALHSDLGAIELMDMLEQRQREREDSEDNSDSDNEGAGMRVGAPTGEPSSPEQQAVGSPTLESTQGMRSLGNRRNTDAYAIMMQEYAAHADGVQLEAIDGEPTFDPNNFAFSQRTVVNIDDDDEDDRVEQKTKWLF